MVRTMLLLWLTIATMEAISVIWLARLLTG